MTAVTTRRTIGAGAVVSAQGIRATQADLLAALPGVRLPDLSELRARGVVGSHLPAGWCPEELPQAQWASVC